MKINRFNEFVSSFNNHYRNADLFFDIPCCSNKIPQFIMFLYQQKLINGAVTYNYSKRPEKKNIHQRIRIYLKFSQTNKRLFDKIEIPKYPIYLSTYNLTNYLKIFQSFFFPLLIIKTNNGLYNGYTAAQNKTGGLLYAIIKK